MKRKIAIVTALFLLATVTVVAETVELEGGTSKDGATTIEAGDTIVLKNTENRWNWFQFYSAEQGTLLTMEPGDPSRWDCFNGEENRFGYPSGRGYEMFDPGCNLEAEEHMIVKEAGYAVLGFQASQFYSDSRNLDGFNFTISTLPPAHDPYKVQDLTVVPGTELQPGQDITVQADFLYQQQQIVNPETAIVTMRIDGEQAGRTNTTLDPGASGSVQFSYTLPYNISIGSHTIEVEATPDWSDEDGDTATAGVSVEAKDLDDDGLYDFREQEIGTEMDDPDTDGDGLADGAEIDAGADPLVVDTDGDGLDDAREVEIGSDPNMTDTDEDGLDDAREVELGTNPTVADTDDDGIDDAQEVEIGTDPTQADTDNDGLDDKTEIERGSDPSSEFQDQENEQIIRDVNDTDGSNQLAVEEDNMNLLLKGTKTEVAAGSPAKLQFSAANFITNDETMNVQLILETPSGVSVSSSSFTESGIGQYTATYTLEPGDTRGLEIDIQASQPGEYGITGHAIYYLGDTKENGSRRSVTIPVAATEEAVDTTGGSGENAFMTGAVISGLVVALIFGLGGLIMREL